MDFSHRLPVVASAVAAATLTVVLAAVRLAGSASLSEPLQVITSGWEQQTLFDVWRVSKGIEVYGDPTRLPFYAGMYNWLFYYAYGAWTKTGLELLRLADVWLPTVARAFTPVAAALGTWTSYRALRLFAPAVPPALVACFAVGLFFGPLVGFWVFTARPDLWAVALEVIAVWVFWRGHRTQPWATLVAVALLCSAAWGMKHLNVYAAGTVFLFLACRGRLLHAGAFSGMMAAVFGATVLVASPDYLPSLTQVALPPVLGTGIRNLGNFAVKSLPQLMPLAVLVGATALRADLRSMVRRDDAVTFAAIGAGLSLLVTIPAATKEGAAENYYFPVAFFLTLLVLTVWNRLSLHEGDKVATGLRAAMSAGWMLQTVALAGVLGGAWGVTSLRFLHEANAQTKACMDALPRPLYVDDLYLSLPWMNPTEPVVFLSYNYPILRARGVEFERGGVGGMVDAGQFRSLLLAAPGPTIDGAPVARHYDVLPQPCGGRTVFRRRS